MMYIGEYKDGVRHGYGEMFYSDNTVFRGLWANDKQEGVGKLTQKDGSVREGIWKDGVRVKWIDE